MSLERVTHNVVVNREKAKVYCLKVKEGREGYVATFPNVSLSM